MVELHQLSPPRGSRKKPQRVGRGIGARKSKTAGRGNKGQLSRSGRRRRPGFEGGQMPLHRRLPKRGFTNIFRTGHEVVNVAAHAFSASAKEKIEKAGGKVEVLGPAVPPAPAALRPRTIEGSGQAGEQPRAAPTGGARGTEELR